MSLFETLSDMSNGYNDTLDSGSYKFESPVTEPEPAPTLSLYNLLDHSREDLDILHGIVKSFTRDKIEPIKENVPAHYTSAIAWIGILETAMKELERRDSEALAEKTAKEITNQTK